MKTNFFQIVILIFIAYILGCYPIYHDFKVKNFSGKSFYLLDSREKFQGERKSVVEIPPKKQKQHIYVRIAFFDNKLLFYDKDLFDYFRDFYFCHNFDLKQHIDDESWAIFRPLTGYTAIAYWYLAVDGEGRIFYENIGDQPPGFPIVPKVLKDFSKEMPVVKEK